MTSILGNYRMVLKIIQIPSIKLLAAVMLTYKMIWADYESINYLKFLDTGVSSEKMVSWNAFIGIPSSLLISALMVKYVAGADFFNSFVYPMPLRSLTALSGAFIVWLTPKLIPASGIAPTYTYIIFMCNDFVYSLIASCMQTGVATFFLKISDPTVSATYVTLLNTILNWGYTWPGTLAIWIVEYITWRDCSLLEPDHVNITMAKVSYEQYAYFQFKFVLAFAYTPTTFSIQQLRAENVPSSSMDII